MSWLPARVTGPEGEIIDGPATTKAVEDLGIFNVARQSPPGATPRGRKPAPVTLTATYVRH